MTVSEYLATGRRRCLCHDVTFVIEAHLVNQYKRRYRDSFRNLVADVILGREEIKPRKVYRARCSQCNKLYMCSSTLKALKSNIEQSGIGLVQ